MAKGEGSADERVRSGVGRFVRRALVSLLLVGGLVLWAGMTSFYTLQPGESALILRLGRHHDTVSTPGFHWHLPVPIETREKVRTGTIRRLEFGDVAKASKGENLDETAIQTGDNNIIWLEFVVRYQIADPLLARYRVEELEPLIRVASQAAMREVVGKTTIDKVLSTARNQIETDAGDRLREILDDYGAGVLLQGVDLQEVQPPDAVRDAFDDVVAADQDKNRAINDAEGYENSIVPLAKGEAERIKKLAVADANDAEADARGETESFAALLEEYQRAPEITRRRLYLETMEEILPDAEMVIIDPGTTQVLPYLPIGKGGAVRGGAKE